MIIRNVLIIRNRNIDIDAIKQDLKEERYPHTFTFGDDLSNDDDITVFDEVWTFGDVRAIKLYKKAVELEMDIWEMMR